MLDIGPEFTLKLIDKMQVCLKQLKYIKPVYT